MAGSGQVLPPAGALALAAALRSTTVPFNSLEKSVAKIMQGSLAVAEVRATVCAMLFDSETTAKSSLSCSADCQACLVDCFWHQRGMRRNVRVRIPGSPSLSGQYRVAKRFVYADEHLHRCAGQTVQGAQAPGSDNVGVDCQGVWRCTRQPSATLCFVHPGWRRHDVQFQHQYRQRGGDAGWGPHHPGAKGCGHDRHLHDVTAVGRPCQAGSQ